ncbi:hypothetical protein [Arcicella rigui]|uniref:Uncharacterized protein n=1 Tax=Arcicella rigui TaxID=797020 RepID=A0ABU5QA05_9BACT|nr:hypothetical protein [Arcicella rigui]MEA5139660.1 hypothetical protein [Arcicella rigui]
MQYARRSLEHYAKKRGSTQNIVEFEATIQEENDQVEDKDDHRLDIRINNSGNKNIELKNWATFKYISFYEIKNSVPTTKESGFKTQLFSYFKNASTMNDFVYIFKFRNGGITLNGAKSKFQTLFQTTIKDKNGNDVNALFDFLRKSNIGLLNYLGKESNILPENLEDDIEFVNKVINNTSTKLYNFIKIQSDI